MHIGREERKINFCNEIVISVTVNFRWTWLSQNVKTSKKNLLLNTLDEKGAEAIAETKSGRSDLILQNTQTKNTQLMTLGFSSEEEKPTNLRRGLPWVRGMTLSNVNGDIR